jgi:CYTH domain-containing protein
MMAYQLFQMKLQLEKENVYTRAAMDIADTAGRETGKKVLIVCDRGFFDNRAYMTAEEFDEALGILGVSADEKLRSYDAVFHLETTAKNAVLYYGTATNAIRDETPAQAAALDDRVIAAWERHPYYRIIENLNGFEDKMRHLVAEIAAFLGEPAPQEIRRRFLVDYPDIDMLEALADCHREEIEQVYLHSAEDEEIRIRRSEREDGEMFYLTRKKTDGIRVHLEAEGRLSEREYRQFLANADPARKPIRKTRYGLSWEKQFFEIDLYPFWDDRAVVEVYLRYENEQIKIPDFLHVQKEVTGDKNYEVSWLARNIPGNEPAAEAGYRGCSFPDSSCPII